MANYKTDIYVNFKLYLDLNELIYLKNLIAQDISLDTKDCNAITYKKDIFIACKKALEEYKNVF